MIRTTCGKLWLVMLAAVALASGCEEPEVDDVAHDELEERSMIEISREIHVLDDGLTCGEGSHMCCDSVGGFQCLTDNPVGDNLCPPGFDSPCDGAGPPPDECGAGTHACCDLAGDVQCLTDAPPGMLNLCPPGYDHC